MIEEDLQPAFDHRWLADLADACRSGSEAGTNLVDIYLERRLELRLHLRGRVRWVEECRTEGAAVRFENGDRREIVAATGATPRTVGRLLSSSIDTRKLQLQRPLPTPELDAPRDWRTIVESWLDDNEIDRGTVMLIERRASVVRPGVWREIRSPLLIRLAHTGGPGALLATWNPGRLPRWSSDNGKRPPRRPWRPDAGRRLPVIFTGGVSGALIHELIGHLLEGDVLAGNASPLSASRGLAIGPSTLTVVDDPTRFDLPGAFTADDEGVPAEPIILVENGVVRGALCDRATAARLHRDPGRGRRSSWHHAPVSRMSNLVVPAGTTAPEAMENDLGNGVIVTALDGASVDPRSGRVVLRVHRGWEIRHGRRRRPLAPFELGGDILEVLRSIDSGMGDDPTPDQRLGWCLKTAMPLPTGAETPTMLVRSLEVV